MKRKIFIAFILFAILFWGIKSFMPLIKDNYKSTNSINKMENINTTKYAWMPIVSAPKNYPIEYVNITFLMDDEYGIEVFESPLVHEGIATGSSSVAPNEEEAYKLPSQVEALWISYSESKVYLLSSSLPISLLNEIFQKGYSRYDKKGNFVKYDYETIDLCLLPSGKVHLYAKGLYSTHLLDWSAQAVETHEYDDELKEKYDVESIQEYVDYMKNTDEDISVSPLNGSDENMWNAYFERFNYNIYFDFETNSNLKSLICNFTNGEYSNERFKDVKIPFNNPSRLKDLKTIWDCNDYQYTAYFYFNEDEMLRVFDEAYGDDRMQKGELNIFVSKYNNLFEISLNVGGKKHILQKTEIRVFRDPLSDLNGESELMYKNYENDHQNIFKGE